ncbi:MAG: extracellular solute-binding protein [Lachnoclostridium sp.]|nr:extracellular solute-binding protein [Lachnospira sp.]MCM1246862.1 extracellular solute-binding protein [Lachnoclostridium sp.]MCM1534730.1 extracellular solute-binding protein [Clostridium sp.]
MKKKWFQRGLCAVLCAAMVMGLTSCGGKGVSQDPNLAKQYVYSGREIGEFANLGDDIGIRDTIKKGDKIYILMEVYHYSTSSEDGQDLRIVTMDADGSNIKMQNLEINLEKPDWGLDEENGGGDSDSYDGTVGGGIMPLARAQAVPMPEVVAPSASEETVPAEDASEDANQDDTQTDDADVTDDEMGIPDIDITDPFMNINEYAGYQNFTFAADAKLLYGIKQYSRNDYTDPYNTVNQRKLVVCAWDMKGNIEWEQDLEEVTGSPGKEYWVNFMTSLADGSLMMVLEGENSTRVIMDQKGRVVEVGEFKSEDENLERLSEIVLKDGGAAYALYWDQDWRYLYVAPYDLETGRLGEGEKMPEVLNLRGYSAMSAGTDTDLVFSTTAGVFTYNIGDEDITQIMSYVNSDLYTNSLNQIIMLDGDNFIGFYNDMDDYTTRVGYFSKVDPKDIPDKKVILIAAFYINYDIRKRIVDFNKESDEYRIIYKEYESYSTQDDYMAGYTQLNNDIISGNMPDILICNPNMPVENYISKGLLADVEKLIEQDEELSKAEFVQSAFDAYRVKDKLYYVIPSFTVRSYMGKQSLVGDRTSWTMAEFRETVDSLPEGTLGFGETTRDSFIYNMLTFCGSDFVDISTGKCDFDSQNFIEMLEYANTLPAELDYENWDDDYWMNYGSQWRENRTLLADVYLNDMHDLNRSIKGSMGEAVSFVGFPTDSGKGSVVSVNNFYAISSKSANKEGAWQFLRYYLTEEYQDELGWQIPTNGASYEKWLKAAMEKPFYEDEDGNKVEYEDTYYINDESIVIPVMTQEEVDRIDAFIKSVDKPAYMNQNVQNIITEEVAAYFEGQKSAEAVAEVIQSRVKVYVNENM